MIFKKALDQLLDQMNNKDEIYLDDNNSDCIDYGNNKINEDAVGNQKEVCAVTLEWNDAHLIIVINPNKKNMLR